MHRLGRTQTLIILLIILFILPIQGSLDFKIDAAIILAGYIFIFIAAKFLKISKNDLGIAPAQLKKSVVSSLAFSIAIAILMTVVFVVNNELFKDDRYDQTFSNAIVSALIVLPLRTVLIEELLFRGLLFGHLARTKSFALAATISSLLFGLWHILPTLGIKVEFLPDSIYDFQKPIIITTVVIATTFAGFVLCYLRKRYDSLLVPIMVHWTINATGMFLVYFAWN